VKTETLPAKLEPARIRRIYTLAFTHREIVALILALEETPPWILGQLRTDAGQALRKLRALD
jgi:hypothetical protein